MMADVYAQIAEKIIEGQETIIGPVAIEQAQQVPDLHVDWKKHEVSITGDAGKAIDTLVERYKELFGQVSVEVSKEAANSVAGELNPDQLPTSLR
jgi:hypothetical protein